MLSKKPPCLRQRQSVRIVIKKAKAVARVESHEGRTERRVDEVQVTTAIRVS